jgi:subtilisin family serine protease
MPPADQWWLSDLGFVEAWSVSRGAGVRIAVIDTGIDAQHPDLAGRVLGGTDFSGVGTPDGLTPVGSADHHGTMVASLIAGQGETTGGVWGVAPDAELLSISIGLGVPAADTDAQLAASIRWAVDSGADIINLSLSRSSTDWPRSWDDALLYAFENEVIVVAALGSAANGPALASAPGIIPGLVTVAGLSRAGVPSEPTLKSLELDVLAPGEQLLGSFPGGGIRSWGGASAAAPIVSGLLALILASDYGLSPAAAIAVLRDSATDVGSPGFDAESGYGAIDAAAALSAVTKPSSVNEPLVELRRWIELYRPTTADLEPNPSNSGQSLVLPPEPGSEASVDDSNPAVSADYPWALPLLLAVFGFGLMVSLLLIIRGNGTRKTRKS